MVVVEASSRVFSHMAGLVLYAFLALAKHLGPFRRGGILGGVNDGYGIVPEVVLAEDLSEVVGRTGPLSYAC